MRPVRGGILVTFRRPELSVIRALAQRRVAIKQGQGKPPRTALSPLDAHYVGMKGEYAVARYLGVLPDVNAYQHGDGGIDLRWRGMTIDVKNASGDLVIPRLTDLRSDVIIVVSPVGVEPDPYLSGVNSPHSRRDVIIRGWVTRDQFQTAHSIKNFGSGPVPYMPLADLNSMLHLGGV